MSAIAFTHVAALASLALIISRLSGVTTLGPWGVAGLFFAMVAGVVGVSVFSLGVTFNYLVSLFYKRPIRQGLLGKPVFKTPLERHFGWLGLVALFASVAVAITSIVLGVQGWDITRLWFYLLGSAMVILMGLQLIVYWILVRVLEELSQHEILTEKDLNFA